MRWLFRVGASSGRDGLDGCDDDRGGHGRRRCLRQARQTSPRSSVHGWSSVPHVRASEVMAFVITATCDRCPEPPARSRGCLAADPWRWMELHHKLIQSCVKMLVVDDEGSDLRWWWWQASERARGLCTVRRVLAFGPITTPSITTNNRRSPPPRGPQSDNKLRS